MELVHSHTRIFRLLGKVVLLGILVIVFGKVILAFLALAFVGLLTLCCARILYLRRAYLRRVLSGLEEAIRSGTVISRVLAATLLATARRLLVGACWILMKLSHILGLACAALGPVTKVLLSFFCMARAITKILVLLPVRGCWSVSCAVNLVLVKIRSQSAVISGTIVEVASGALVGALVFNLPDIGGRLLQQDVSILGPRACAAAAFGGFLGLVLSLSRLRRGAGSRNAPLHQK